MPVIVRNTLTNSVVYAKGDIELRWTAAGDPSGNDVQWAPDEIINNPDFLETLARGVLVVEEADDDVMAKITKFVSRRSGIRPLSAQADNPAGLNVVIDRSQDKDLTMGTCLECGTPVLTTVKLNGDKPPLCNRHEALAPYYSLTESGSQGDAATNDRSARGSLTRTWTKAQIGAIAR